MYPSANANPIPAKVLEFKPKQDDAFEEHLRYLRRLKHKLRVVSCICTYVYQYDQPTTCSYMEFKPLYVTPLVASND
jgi:hypothetical protein